MPASPFGSDPWLEAKLRNVPLPAGLLDRLVQVPDAPIPETANSEAPSFDAVGLGSTDAELDVALRNVPLPAGLLRRLERVAQPARPTAAVWQLAIAATLLVAVGLIYYALGGARNNPGGAVDQAHLAQQGSHSNPIKNLPIDANHAAHDPTRPDASTLADRKRANQLDQSDDAPGGDTPHGNTPRSDTPHSDIVAVDKQIAGEIPDEDGLAVSSSPVESNESGVTDLPRQFSADGLFGAVERPDRIPDLEIAHPPLARGISPPRLPGYDLVFLLKHGDHPFVSPSAHKELKSIDVPLSKGTSSYDLAWAYLKQGRLPPADEVRTEELLAAMDYQFPPPTEGAIAIRTGAGPEPLDEPGLGLLQVALQAAPLPDDAAGVHLIVALDTSEAMRFGGRLDRAIRALARLAVHLRAADRVSLVLAAEKPIAILTAGDRAELLRALSELRSLVPAGPSNLAGSLVVGGKLATGQHAGDGLPVGTPSVPRGITRLVLISCGGAEIPADATPKLEGVLAELKESGATMAVLDMSYGDMSSRDVIVGEANGRTRNAPREADPQLAYLATAGKGQVFQAGDAASIQSHLSEFLLGRSSQVAKGATLKLTFNPETVAAYRLMGHEPTTLTAPLTTGTQIDLNAGETVEGLFEIWLKPGGGDDVAVAEAAWHDPTSGSQRKISQRISRLQFAKSFVEAPLSLQAAAVVAETSEILRGSYFAPTSRPLTRVLELAAQVQPRLGERGDFREFVAFIELAEKVRQPRPAANSSD